MPFKNIIMKTLRMLLVLTLLCGGLYPAAVSLLAGLFFPDQAGGSLLVNGSRASASRLLAYGEAGTGYFHFRPSACGYSTLPGSGSNLAPSSKAWHDSLAVRRRHFLSENGLAETTQVPAEMLCASASGLDPHISPLAAHLQVARIVACRGGGPEDEQRLHALIEQTTREEWSVLQCAPCVNVCELNFALDNTFGMSTLQRERP
jgi:potassium-transporting ATPase KdpC subunit